MRQGAASAGTETASHVPPKTTIAMEARFMSIPPWDRYKLRAFDSGSKCHDWFWPVASLSGRRSNYGGKVDIQRAGLTALELWVLALTQRSFPRTRGPSSRSVVPTLFARSRKTLDHPGVIPFALMIAITSGDLR